MDEAGTAIQDRPCVVRAGQQRRAVSQRSHNSTVSELTVLSARHKCHSAQDSQGHSRLSDTNAAKTPTTNAPTNRPITTRTTHRRHRAPTPAALLTNSFVHSPPAEAVTCLCFADLPAHRHLAQRPSLRLDSRFLSLLLYPSRPTRATMSQQVTMACVDNGDGTQTCTLDQFQPRRRRLDADLHGNRVHDDAGSGILLRRPWYAHHKTLRSAPLPAHSHYVASLVL